MMCGAAEKKGMQGKNISLGEKKNEGTEIMCSLKKKKNQDREQPLPSSGQNAVKVASCGPFP